MTLSAPRLSGVSRAMLIWELLSQLGLLLQWINRGWDSGAAGGAEYVCK